MKKVLMIGNAHIDPVWLWQWQEGFHEVKATFRSALDRMNENPDFVFTCACAQYYLWVEENDPEMFEEIRARVKEGRWQIVGGMWIQPDMNVPSGESIARQLLYSQRYFAEKFGDVVRTGYNVDTFGHNAMMPQLLRRAGIENYVWMRPSVVENPNIPEGPMVWEAPDGSRVTAYRIFGEYTRAHDVPEKIDMMLGFSDRIGKPVMCFYGVGNHGGGPTIENLRQIDGYLAENPKGGDVAYAGAPDYFRMLKENSVELPVWKSELQHHASGCYSTHSNTKKLHRQTENALLRMEALGTLSHALTGHELKKPFVMQAWTDLMFNEFHDIMGGCSMPEALDDAEMQFNEALSIAAREENAALQRLSWKVDTSKGLPPVRSKEEDWKFWGIRGMGTPVVVFNPHGFDAEDTVHLHRPIRSVRDDSGNPVPSQIIRASRTNNHDRWDGMFRAKVPALGYRLYWVFFEETDAPENTLSVSGTHIENAFLRAEFDPATGALTSLFDKKHGVEALKAPSRALLTDVEHSDTWGHMLFKFDKEAGELGDASVTVLEEGPVRAVLRVTTRFNDSELEQKYILYANADQLEMECRLNLREKHRMLKLCFPTAHQTDVAEISGGVIERTGCGDEEPCQRWVAMQGAEYGLALLNNGRYSYSAPNGELRMTVANTSICADHYGQNHRDDTCRFMDVNELRFTCALVPYSGSWKNAGLNRRAALLNRPMPHVEETYHAGPLAGEYRGAEISASNIELIALKRAENGRGTVVRLSETVGRAVEASVALPVAGRVLNLSFGPWEIKSLYLPDDPAVPAKEILLTELDAE